MDNINTFFNLGCVDTHYDKINKKYQIWITLIYIFFNLSCADTNYDK